METSYDIIRSGTKKTLAEIDTQNSVPSFDENVRFDTNRLNTILSAEYLVSEEKSAEEIKKQKDIFELKSVLDELIDDNYHKEEILDQLISVCQSLTGLASPIKPKSSSSRRSPELFQNSNVFALLSPKSSTRLLENEIIDLKSRLEEAELSTSDEAFNSKGLIEMKAKEWKNLQIWKERVKEAMNLQKEIDPKHDEVNSTKIVAKNNFILAQNQNMNYIYITKNIKLEQERKYEAQLKIRDDLRSEIVGIIENIGQQSLISERRKENYNSMMAALKVEIEKYEGSSVKEKENNQKLVYYRERLEIIKKIIANYDDTLQITEPLDEKSIRNIIQVYNEMSFKESSLSDRFQELTHEEIKKKQACLEISQQLELLKADQISPNPSSFSSTFNQKKMILDDKGLINFKLDHLHDMEKCLLKMFFQVLNFGSFLCSSVVKITKYCENNEFDAYTIQKAQRVINDLQKGFGNPEVSDVNKRNFMRKRYTLVPNKQPHSIFKTDVELSPRANSDTTIYSLLSAGDIYKLYRQYWSDRIYDKKLVAILTDNPIIGYFLTLKQIEAYFQDQSTTNDLFENLWQLNLQAHLKLQEQFMNLSHVTRDLIWQTSKNIAAKTEEIQEKSPLLEIQKKEKTRGLQRRDTKAFLISQKAKKNDPLSRDESNEGSQNTFKSSETQKIDKKEDEFDLTSIKSPNRETDGNSKEDDDSLCTDLESVIKFRNPPQKKIEIGGLSNHAVLQEMKDIKSKLKGIKSQERKANATNVENTKFFWSPKSMMFGLHKRNEEGATQPTRPSTYSISTRKHRKIM
ncbi:unnamed protein product [Blepharisma stoltei]|uniref:Uncharacterized protein n=1 Tax=Blepharisma stoltei TaxID=1481888 RepID=A0AAU9ISM2_9CILI|nr:unnamed protein product [Blepharisma stoltei]